MTGRIIPLETTGTGPIRLFLEHGGNSFTLDVSRILGAAIASEHSATTDRYPPAAIADRLLQAFLATVDTPPPSA